MRALVLAGTRNFREAAKVLELSQPSVSAAIASLEHVIGAPLAVRNSRKVELAALGSQVAGAARHIVAGVDELMASVAGAGGGGAATGTLMVRLGIIPTVAPYILAPVLRTAARRFPGLQLEVAESQTARLIAGIEAAELDACVLALPSGVGGLTGWPLYWEDFVLLLPPEHPLAGRTGVPPEILREVPLLLLEEGHCLSGQALEVCQQVGAANRPSGNPDMSNAIAGDAIAPSDSERGMIDRHTVGHGSIGVWY